MKSAWTQGSLNEKALDEKMDHSYCTIGAGFSQNCRNQEIVASVEELNDWSLMYSPGK